MSDAREVVLTRIRDRLQGIARPELPDPEPQVPAASEVALVEQFCSMLSSCGVTIHRVPCPMKPAMYRASSSRKRRLRMTKTAIPCVVLPSVLGALLPLQV